MNTKKPAPPSPRPVDDPNVKPYTNPHVQPGQDPNTDAEESTNVEAGFNYRTARSGARLGAFWNDYANLIVTAMSVDKTKRYQSMDELTEALNKLDI